MDKTKIIISKKYSHRRGKYICELSVYLPSINENGLICILPILRGRVRFLGRRLNFLWGANESNIYSYRKKKFKSRYIGTLIEKVDKYLSKELKKLKQVVETNRKKRMNIPKDVVIKISLHELLIGEEK